MKKKSLMLISSLLLIALAVFILARPDVTDWDCTDISVSDTYILNGSDYNCPTGISITANDVIFDLNGSNVDASWHFLSNNTIFKNGRTGKENITSPQMQFGESGTTFVQNISVINISIIDRNPASGGHASLNFADSDDIYIEGLILINTSVINTDQANPNANVVFNKSSFTDLSIDDGGLLYHVFQNTGDDWDVIDSNITFTDDFNASSSMTGTDNNWINIRAFNHKFFLIGSNGTTVDSSWFRNQEEQQGSIQFVIDTPLNNVNITNNFFNYSGVDRDNDFPIIIYMESPSAEYTNILFENNIAIGNNPVVPAVYNPIIMNDGDSVDYSGFGEEIGFNISPVDQIVSFPDFGGEHSFGAANETSDCTDTGNIPYQDGFYVPLNISDTYISDDGNRYFCLKSSFGEFTLFFIDVYNPGVNISLNFFYNVPTLATDTYDNTRYFEFTVTFGGTTNLENWTYRNNTFIDIGDALFMNDETGSNFLIEDNKGFGLQGGFTVRGINGVVMRDNVLVNATNNGLQVRLLDDAIIENNSISFVETGAVFPAYANLMHGILMRTATNTFVRYNNIDNMFLVTRDESSGEVAYNNVTNVFRDTNVFYTPFAIDSCENTLIHDNYIDGIVELGFASFPDEDVTVRIRQNSQGCQIYNNTFLDTITGRGKLVTDLGGVSPAFDVTLTDNIINLSIDYTATSSGFNFTNNIMNNGVFIKGNNSTWRNNAVGGAITDTAFNTLFLGATVIVDDLEISGTTTFSGQSITNVGGTNFNVIDNAVVQVKEQSVVQGMDLLLVINSTLHVENATVKTG